MIENHRFEDSKMNLLQEVRRTSFSELEENTKGVFE